jgi:UDPglucose 6-dehydrogenase
VPIFEATCPSCWPSTGTRREFTTDLGAAVERSEAIFIAVGTPQGDTGAADLSYVEAVVSEIARSINGYKVIVEKSTVPVYTNEWIRRVLHRHGVAPQSFDVVSNPEFLREGTAIIDFLHPDRIVVGANTERSAEVLRRIYEPLTGGSYYAQPGALCQGVAARIPSGQAAGDLGAERGDHQARLQCLPGLKISFINAVANLAEAVDADIEDIAAGMGMDSRIGPRFLRAGLGYGGSCFPKDVAAFHWVAQQQGVDFQLLQEIRKINETRRTSSSTRCVGAVDPARQAAGRPGPGLQGRYRRHSRVSGHRRHQKTAGSRRLGHGYDPAAMERAKEVLPPSEKLSYAGGLYEAAKDADAVLILTDWKEFAEIDLARLNQAVRFPIVIDGRNLYKPQEMLDHGFTYVSVGRPASYQAQQGKPRKLDCVGAELAHNQLELVFPLLTNRPVDL